MTPAHPSTQIRGLSAGSFRSSKSLLMLITLSALPFAGLAGTVNVNFTDTSSSVSGALDGTAILGGGIWSRIINDQGTTPFSLRNSNDVLTGVTVVNNSIPSGDSQANGNPVQSESWFSIGTLNLTIGGLVPNGSYRLACYSDVDGFIGFVSPTTLYSANGVSATTTNSNASARTLPGISGIDYVLITTKANGAGQIQLTAAQIAGLQIQGVLPGEAGPKMDCMISRAAGSLSGKGQGVFGVKPNRAQSLSQRASGGVKRTYFVNAKNIGAEFDSAFLMAFPDRGTKVRIVDQTTRKNVTAAALARRHRFDIDAGATSRFTVQVSPRGSGSSKTLNVGIGASPSTLTTANQDVVTCVLKP